MKRPQSALAFAALALGAAVASLLLNLYGGAQRKMQIEFRSYGPNVILAPTTAGQSGQSGQQGQQEKIGSTSTPGAPRGLLNASVIDHIEAKLQSLGLGESKAATVPVLYSAVSARSATDSTSSSSTLVGVGADLAALYKLNPAWKVTAFFGSSSANPCALGVHAAERLGLKPGDLIAISSSGANPSQTAPEPDDAAAQRVSNPGTFSVAGLISSGGPEDDQLFLPLEALQRLSGLEGSVTLVQMRISGTSDEVESAIGRLAQALPSLEVRPVREIVQSEGKVLGTIRGLMMALSGLILGVILLCVMATVAAIVLERAKEVAVMKALGASERTLFGLLLAEIGALGIGGGLVGFALGAVLARRLGLDLFGIALNPDWHALLPVVGAAVLASALPALVPVWSVRSIDPARSLRGE